MFAFKFFEFFGSMTVTDWCILSTTFLAYIFIFVGTWKAKGEGQSLISWLLWLVLDIVLFIPTWQEGGKSAFMLVPSILGSISISFLLLIFKKFEWKLTEWLSLGLTLASVAVWYFSQNNSVTITFAVISQVIAGWPLTKKSWENPKPGWTTIGYLIFIASCVLSLAIREKNHLELTLEGDLFPAALGLQTVADTIPLIIKSFERLKLKNKTKKPLS
jgi:hypothetical protein